MSTGSKGRFETCLYVEGGVVGDWGLGGYYVDEAAGDVDQLSHGFALGVGLNSGAGEGDLSHFFFRDGGGCLHAVSEASVDLDDEGNYFLRRQVGVPLGEGAVVDAVGATRPLPELLGQVGRKGGQHEEEFLGAFAPECGVDALLVPRLGEVVGEFHEAGDGGVELEAVQVCVDLSL